MNLRTLRGTLESKLQRSRDYGMLGFVVPEPLCALGSVVPVCPWNAGKCSLCHIAQCNVPSPQRPAAGASPWSLYTSEANHPLGPTLSNNND